jgi:hypothetical protein
MLHTTRYRTTALVFAATAALMMSAVTGGQGLDVAAAATQPVTVLAGSDYATTTFGDPWDYNNSADLVLDGGPALGMSGLVMSGGTVRFNAHSGYVSPVWGGYGNEVPVEREGTRPGNALNAGTYTRMHLHMWVSVLTSVELSWYTCGALRATCKGMMGFNLKPGWNDIDVPIVRNRPTPQPWAGSIVGLRLAVGVPVTTLVPSGRGSMSLDRLRIYQPSASSAITWAAPSTSAATLWWTDIAGVLNPVPGQRTGLVQGAPQSANASTPVSTNVAGYAPGTTFWSVAGGVKTLVGSIAPAPLPVIDSPSAAGCVDYATRTLGRPWTFTSPRSLAARANIGAVSFTAGGVLNATNAGPRRNDPSITLPIAGGGIDGRVYHNLTIVESYDGPFYLANRPGGGAMARVLWQSPGHALLAQTAPLVTFTGKRSITVDMAMPATRLTDPEGPATQRYAFASASPITRLRYDPNEDPGARRWHLFSVRLTADCQAPHTFAVTWHDNWYRAGSTVQLFARSAAGVMYPIGSTTEQAGLNRFVVPLASMPRGRYTVVIYVTNADDGRGTAVATGPLVKL